MEDFHADLNIMLVEGYTEYYEKWPDKRLEGFSVSQAMMRLWLLALGLTGSLSLS